MISVLEGQTNLLKNINAKTKLMPRIANCKAELRLFERMLKGKERKRILLVEGPSERGKSVLLAEFAEVATGLLGSRCCARADLKGGLALDDLHHGFFADLGPDVCPTCANQSLANPISLRVEADMSGAEFRDDNKVEVKPVINLSNKTSIRKLGDALLNDLRKWTEPLALIIDTFEASTPEASKWIVQQLLPCVRHNEHLIIVIGGQTVPLPRESQLAWGQLAIHHKLEICRSVDDWHEFACSCHPAFPKHHIESVCMGLAQRPTAIREFIDTIIRTLPSQDEGGNA